MYAQVDKKHILKLESIKVRAYKLVFIVVSLLLLFIKTLNNVHAQTIYTDSFDDGNVDNWIVPREPCSVWKWQTLNNMYGIVNPGCMTESIPSDLQIPQNTEYQYDVDMLLVEAIDMDRNFIFKYKDSKNWYGVHIYDNYVYIQKVVNGIEIGSPYWTSLYTSFNPDGFIPNQMYHFRIKVLKNKITLEINDLLIANITDGLPQFENYSAGLQASGGDTVWFDNFSITQIQPVVPPTTTPQPTTTPLATPTATQTPITSEVPSATPSPNSESAENLYLHVPDLKQYSLNWGNKIYANSKYTIKELGCALTSAAMVLRYHGHNVNPETLNNWLKSQNDGYIANNLVNWLAISRYTKIHDSKLSPTLEYKKLNTSFNILYNEIKNKRPAILKETGHFVVVTGKLNNTYTINDPGYNNRPTLASYDNKILAINSFTPSHSDLSYIMFVSSPDLQINLTDNQDVPIQSISEVEDPIHNLLTGKYTGDVYKITYIEKPKTGDYKLKVTGNNGRHTLLTYFYDIDGNAHVNEIKFYARDSETNIYNMHYTKEPYAKSHKHKLDKLFKHIFSEFYNNRR